MTPETPNNAGAGIPPEALGPDEQPPVSGNPVTAEQAEIARLRAENERLRNAEIEGLKATIREQAAVIEAARIAKEQADLLIEAEIKKSEAGVANASEASSKERYAITIDEGQEQDPSTVFVSVNGRAYLIKRGEMVAVPKDVLHVLDNAITLNYVAQKDSNGMPNGVVSRAARRFPYANHAKVIDKNGVYVENDYMVLDKDGKLVSKMLAAA